MIIIDNYGPSHKVATYLRRWAEDAPSLDIATGYFDVTAFGQIAPQWERFPQIRIVMGDQVSRTTKQAFLDAALPAIDAKRSNDFLPQLPAVLDAMRQGRIRVRVYRREKFHAKAFIAYTGTSEQAMVGSSNFTVPGLIENIELNVLLQGDVSELRYWYDAIWDGAEDITPEILRVVERHLHDYAPFEVYLRAMTAYFENRLAPVSAWEQHTSLMYPRLSQYQRDGYHALMQIAARYNGALLCDGVGLGKTFVGLMLIERLLYERKRVALFVPKATRVGVWEAKLRQLLPNVGGSFSNFALYNHSDLTRGGDFPHKMREVAEEADAIIVDEAHHFRNRAPSRSQALFNIAAGKPIFLLTATPINNALIDVQHLIEYFSRRAPEYFAGSLGIRHLGKYIRRLEASLAPSNTGKHDVIVEEDVAAYERELGQDPLFQAVVVQRSRSFVRRSLANEHQDHAIRFPVRRDPVVISYSLQDTYGDLLDDIRRTFDSDNPHLLLPLYVPVNYLRASATQPDAFEAGRQRQVVGLIRTILLKRFESSVASFRATCEDLLVRLMHFFKQKADARVFENWKRRSQDVLERLAQSREGRTPESDDDDDFNHDERLTKAFRRKLDDLTPDEYDIDAMVADAHNDLELLARFLRRLAHHTAESDAKLQALLHAMTTVPVLRDHKVLIFTQYRSTARHLETHMRAAGIPGVARVDSTTGKNISKVVRAFAPYYNGTSSAALQQDGQNEVRVLVATDILAEGLNLQDATCIINYDLHWNPVRLMQRIGRVDRRLEPDAEQRIVAHHPDRAALRGVVHIFNFLPPDELDVLLNLYKRVAHKTLRISRVFGIEGRKLLTPNDDYSALRDFNELYEGSTSPAEELYLAYQRLLADYPDAVAAARTLPQRVFSGLATPDARATGLFFCYDVPQKVVGGDGTAAWQHRTQPARWYFYEFATGNVLEDAAVIHARIACAPTTPRHTHHDRATLSTYRQRVEQHITQTALSAVERHEFVEPTLLAWLEVAP